jgi:hypothetical protein
MEHRWAGLRWRYIDYCRTPLWGRKRLRLTEAYEATLKKLGLIDRSDPITQLIAKKIIEIGQRGIRDPEQISALTTKELGVN